MLRLKGMQDFRLTLHHLTRDDNCIAHPRNVTGVEQVSYANISSLGRHLYSCGEYSLSPYLLDVLMIQPACYRLAILPFNFDYLVCSHNLVAGAGVEPAIFGL